MLKEFFELISECSGLTNEVCEHNCTKISGGKEGLILYTVFELRCCGLSLVVSHDVLSSDCTDIC